MRPVSGPPPLPHCRGPYDRGPVLPQRHRRRDRRIPRPADGGGISRQADPAIRGSRAGRLAEADRQPVHSPIPRLADRRRSDRGRARRMGGCRLARHTFRSHSALEPLLRAPPLPGTARSLQDPGIPGGRGHERLAQAARSLCGLGGPTRILLPAADRRPESIPFDFQYLLDIEYAVGRLSFDDADRYRSYAESVVDYEKASAVGTSRQIVYWGTPPSQGPGDGNRRRIS